MCPHIHTSERTQLKSILKAGTEQWACSLSIPSHPHSLSGTASPITKTTQKPSSDSYSSPHICSSLLLDYNVLFSFAALFKTLLLQSAALMWSLIQARYPQTDRNYSGLFQTVSKGTIKNLLLFWSFFYLGTSNPQVYIFREMLRIQTYKLRKSLLNKWMLVSILRIHTWDYQVYHHQYFLTKITARYYCLWNTGLQDC